MKKKNLLIILGLVLACIVILGATLARTENNTTDEQELYRHYIVLTYDDGDGCNRIYTFDLLLQSDEKLTTAESLKSNMDINTKYLCNGMNPDYYPVVSIYFTEDCDNFLLTVTDLSDGRVGYDYPSELWEEGLIIEDYVTRIL